MKVTNGDRAEVALYHLGILREHLKSGSIEELLIFDAVCVRLMAILDEASKIDPELRALLFGDIWPAMWSTRNHITHGYFTVNRQAIVDSLGSDLDAIEVVLRSIASSAPA